MNVQSKLSKPRTSSWDITHQQQHSKLVLYQGVGQAAVQSEIPIVFSLRKGSSFNPLLSKHIKVIYLQAPYSATSVNSQMLLDV